MLANSSRKAGVVAQDAVVDRCESRPQVLLTWGLCALLALLAGCETAPLAPAMGSSSAVATPTPRVGDTYVYRYSDGYGNLPGGTVRYSVDKIENDRITVAVTTDSAREGLSRTEVYTANGNRVRHPLLSHNLPLDREYSPVYPAYAFPLDQGKSWSVRVAGINPASGHPSQMVHVNGKVVGPQRIRVPAGEFDTIKIVRDVYINNLESHGIPGRTTHLIETEWYAPALGRPVRIENNAEWMVGGFKDPWVLGDWNVYELVSAPTIAVAGEARRK